MALAVNERSAEQVSQDNVRVRRCERLRAEEMALHRRLLRCDESALLECYDRFAGLVHCAAAALQGAARADDLTERLFVELWRRPAAFHPGRGPMSLQLLALLGPAPGRAAPTA